MRRMQFIAQRLLQIRAGRIRKLARITVQAFAGTQINQPITGEQLSLIEKLRKATIR